MSSQLGGKSTPRSSSSSPHNEKRTNGEAIFSKIGPHNQPHEFNNQNKSEIPKFLESKEVLYTTYDVREATNDWQQLSDECRNVLPFDKFIRAYLKFKQGGSGNRESTLNHELNYTMGKVTIPSFDGSSQMSASAWLQLSVYF